MKKLSVFILLILSIRSFAQVVPNGGFENWPDKLMPVGWGGMSVLRDTASYSGSYAARVRSAVQGFEGYCPGNLYIKVPAISASGTVSLMIKIDTLESVDAPSQAIISIDTFKNNTPAPYSYDTSYRISLNNTTTQYVPVTLSFRLPPQIDSFWINIIALNYQGPLTTSGFSSFRVDDISVSFSNGIKLPLMDNALSIYPIPAHNKLTGNAGRLGYKKVEILNTLGHIAITRNIPVNSNEMDVEVINLSPGIYFARFSKNDGRIIVKEFIKE